VFFVLCYCVRRLHVTRCGVREEQRLGLLREESCIKFRSCLSDKSSDIFAVARRFNLATIKIVTNHLKVKITVLFDIWKIFTAMSEDPAATNNPVVTLTRWVASAFFIVVPVLA
jgi:hypothetical protein